MKVRTPDLPASYWAVIFTNQLNDDAEGYEQMAGDMVELASRQPGFLGIDSVRGPDGKGITVSYWRSEDDIVAWKGVAEHLEAQLAGAQRFYSSYSTRVAQVSRNYEFRAD
ncbi:MAG: antibiotic biosynthesis monooxygenase [Acidimicrobiales bacterium]|nr:antibiotic biosynthesis monooxygenase [Acidimicrobiales bacterium]